MHKYLQWREARREQAKTRKDGQMHHKTRFVAPEVCTEHHSINKRQKSHYRAREEARTPFSTLEKKRREGRAGKMNNLLSIWAKSGFYIAWVEPRRQKTYKGMGAHSFLTAGALKWHGEPYKPIPCHLDRITGECDPFCIKSGRWKVISGHEHTSEPFLDFLPPDCSKTQDWPWNRVENFTIFPLI